ncbi:NAD(P)/FAD-dependent oxidoreductase [Nocardia nova]|uniref:NAD(P)/FAD-dependent oxidoreductase n=1 Tax=Nocardia nova TaxID=37330 RepID=UPI00340EF253
MTATTHPRPRGTVAVVGGSLAGTLAAWALRDLAESIVVFERDRYPETPVPRPGVPQGHHAHLFLEGGHRALEDMMPGIRAELLAAGATRVAMSRELAWLTSAGWMAEYDSDLGFLSATRPLIDHVIRARVAREPRIRIIENAEVVGLLGTARTVTGVQIRERGSLGGVRDVPSDLVVDASGRVASANSHSTARWLARLGATPAPEDRVDAGVTYTSRLYHRPTDIDLGPKAIYLQTAPSQPRTGALLPVEGRRWMVSLGGMRGAEPAKGRAGFEQALTQLRNPLLRNALTTAHPASNVRLFPAGPSVRRYYERCSPDGLVVIGDAACTVNPCYGQGMTLAVRGAQALRKAAIQCDMRPEIARIAQKSIAAVSKDAWMMSSAEDLRFPATTGGSANPVIRAQHRYLDRVLDRATQDPRVTDAFTSVMSLITPPTALFRPAILSSVLLGAR